MSFSARGGVDFGSALPGARCQVTGVWEAGSALAGARVRSSPAVPSGVWMRAQSATLRVNACPRLRFAKRATSDRACSCATVPETMQSVHLWTA